MSDMLTNGDLLREIYRQVGESAIEVKNLTIRIEKADAAIEDHERRIRPLERNDFAGERKTWSDTERSRQRLVWIGIVVSLLAAISAVAATLSMGGGP